MGRSRSRSRSPRRRGGRSRSRSRSRGRENRRRREREDSREKRRDRSRSRGDRSSEDRSRSRDKGSSSKARKTDKMAPMPALSEADFAGKSEEEIAMMKIMGFAGFNTTKGKEVAGNNVGDAAGKVHKLVKRKYRQYMNRKGGFNRPLDECK